MVSYPTRRRYLTKTAAYRLTHAPRYSVLHTASQLKKYYQEMRLLLTTGYYDENAIYYSSRIIKIINRFNKYQGTWSIYKKVEEIGEELKNTKARYKVQKVEGFREVRQPKRECHHAIITWSKTFFAQPKLLPNLYDKNILHNLKIGLQQHKLRKQFSGIQKTIKKTLKALKNDQSIDISVFRKFSDCLQELEKVYLSFTIFSNEKDILLYNPNILNFLFLVRYALGHLHTIALTESAKQYIQTEEEAQCATASPSNPPDAYIKYCLITYAIENLRNDFLSKSLSKEQKSLLEKRAAAFRSLQNIYLTEILAMPVDSKQIQLIETVQEWLQGNTLNNAENSTLQASQVEVEVSSSDRDIPTFG
jgi:hypothetical protein